MVLSYITVWSQFGTESEKNKQRELKQTQKQEQDTENQMTEKIAKLGFVNGSQLIPSFKVDLTRCPGDHSGQDQQASKLKIEWPSLE